MNVLAVEFGESEEMIPVVGSPPWTPEEDKRLRKLALTGTSVAPMAKQMHRSTASVRNRAARLKIVVATSSNQRVGLKAKGR
jgi:hypothetical protein